LRFLQGFGKKTRIAKLEHCIDCNKELTGHKYKPSPEWKMSGLLCSDCHIERTKEFILKAEEKKQELAQREKEESTCHLCNSLINSVKDRKKPEWKWNMDSGTILCPQCYENTEAEFNRKLNFCAICGTKMGFIRYNPKQRWRIDGQLCRRCWDEQNLKSKKADG
jgi:ribosomal protein L34E